MNAFLYILRCRDGSYYVGTTRSSLDERIGAHNLGHYGGYTVTRRPVELVFQDFDRITDAIAAERQVKGWRRDKKEALIAGRFDLLPALAARSRSRREVLARDRASFETPATRAPQDEDGLVLPESSDPIHNSPSS
jgi:predicted GIY-YIG superfamily endonuclease